LFDGIDMPLVHDLQPLKLMRPVFVPEHRTVTANRPLASVAVIVHGSVVVLRTDFFGFGLLGLKGVDSRCYLLHETAVYQLVHTKRGTTVWALLSLLNQPFLCKLKSKGTYLDASTATQFGAVRAHHSVVHFVQAYKAFEDFLQILGCGHARSIRSVMIVVMLGLLL
jgi:hypothetical protein